MSNKIQYKWDPADYAAHSIGQFTWAQELIAKLNLGGDESILDLGCGDGKVTALLANRVPDGSV
ncbi:MAG TPA: SAM-dependent methyltransferase, partial [Chloroflexi bacterium]|nr:SAM-dependent methyltransferase [Chloroflexota bacterium]